MYRTKIPLMDVIIEQSDRLETARKRGEEMKVLFLLLISSPISL